MDDRIRNTLLLYLARIEDIATSRLKREPTLSKDARADLRLIDSYVTACKSVVNLLPRKEKP